MSIYIDTIYISGLSTRVDGLVRKSNTLWNLRCPICGDSLKNKHKKRGFFYQREGAYFYKCHNCNVSLSLGNFLKQIDSELYKKYYFDSYGHQKNNKINKTKKIQHHQANPNILKSAIRLTQLSSNHPVRVFIDNRLIPKKFHHKLYYVDNFKKYIKSANIKHVGEIGTEPRLLIPFFDKNSNVFAIQGRALNNQGLRYITFRFDKDCEIKYPFGIDNLDANKHIYVVEGPLDSLFVDNCLGIASSNIVTNSKQGYIYKLNKDVLTIIFDNEKRNLEIIKKIELAIQQGFNVCLWPDDIKQKDINEMVLGGHINIKQIIDENTYNGLSACIKINNWKRTL